MNKEAHKKGILESLTVLAEAIAKGVVERQRTIGFHCSAALADLLELYLHEQNLIDPGATIKHDFFTSERRALEKLPQEFPHKKKLIALLREVESRRNLLCYGKRQPEQKIDEYLALFNEGKALLASMGVSYE